MDGVNRALKRPVHFALRRVELEDNFAGGGQGCGVLRKSMERKHGRCYQKIEDRRETASKPIHLATFRFTLSVIASQSVSLWLPEIPPKTLRGVLPEVARTVPARRPNIAGCALSKTDSNPAAAGGGSWYSDASPVGGAPAGNSQGFRCPMHRRALLPGKSSDTVLLP